MNPARTRHEGGGALRARRSAPGQTAEVRLRLTPARPRAPAPTPSAPTSTPPFAARRTEADEFYAAITPPDVSDDAAPRDAAGAGRHAVEQAVLLLRRRRAGWRSTASIPSVDPRAQRARNGAWAHMVNARRHLDARQVGVPLVRGVGPRLPHDRRSAMVDPDFAKEQLAADARPALPAPERPDPRLRVELRRRQPAGARVGGLVRLQARSRPRGGTGDVAFLERIFQKLLLNFTWWVNRKDRRGPQRLRGRLPRARQHRRLRPQRAAADRRPPRAGRRHRLDGVLLPEHAADRARAGAARPRLRGPRREVLRALPVDRRRHGPHRRRTTSCGTRRTASSTTCCGCPTATPTRLKVRSMVGPAAALRLDRRSRPSVEQRLPDFDGRGSAPSPRATPSCWPTSPSPGRAGHGDRRPAVAARRGQAAPRAGAHARRERVPEPVRHPLALRASTATSPYVFSVERRDAIASTTSRRSRPAGCSAATPTGAGRSGCRSTRCSSAALLNLLRVLRRRLHGRVPDRLRAS